MGGRNACVGCYVVGVDTVVARRGILEDPTPFRPTTVAHSDRRGPGTTLVAGASFDWPCPLLTRRRTAHGTAQSRKECPDDDDARLDHAGVGRGLTLADEGRPLRTLARGHRGFGTGVNGGTG